MGFCSQFSSHLIVILLVFGTCRMYVQYDYVNICTECMLQNHWTVDNPIKDRTCIQWLPKKKSIPQALPHLFQKFHEFPSLFRLPPLPLTRQ